MTRLTLQFTTNSSFTAEDSGVVKAIWRSTVRFLYDCGQAKVSTMPLWRRTEVSCAAAAKPFSVLDISPEPSR